MNHPSLLFHLKKNLIRQQIKIKRSRLEASEVSFRSDLIFKNIVNSFFPLIKDIKNVNLALYKAVNNEVETKQIIDYLLNNINNTNIALPKINDNNYLDFVLYDPKEDLTTNHLYKKIYEPNSNIKIIPQIIFTPLVACDKSGNRIGMGAGFYDKTIELMKKSHNILLVGLAYNFQIIDKIENDPHDQKLDFIICEDQIIKCCF